MLRKFLVIMLLAGLLAPAARAQQAGEAVNRLIHMPLPQSLDICGERVPLEQEDVAERLEYEMLIMLGNPVQTALWIKRIPRFMPEVERELSVRGLPRDLKYVAVIESSLRADAVSSAGAVGPWQFMAATGRSYGLGRDSWGDERRDWSLSTRAALDFLKELHEKTSSWALSLAAYNCGLTRVRSAMESQRHDNFYGLVLPEETERYVFRFLAAKAILENPSLYGIELNEANLYNDRGVVPVYVETKRPRTSLLTFSKAAGLSYRYFLELNPRFNAGDVPRGSYTFFIPSDRVERFDLAMEEWKKANTETVAVAKKAAPAPRPIPVLTADPATPAAAQALPPQPPVGEAAQTQPAAATQPLAAQDPAQSDPAAQGSVASYIVRKGDTLSAIAKKYAVTVERLINRNGLSSSTLLKVGQQIIVPKED